MGRGVRTMLLVGSAFAGGVVSGSVGRAQNDDPYASLAVFARVLGYIERSYVETVPVERLVRAAIRGMVGELDGPSAYLDPTAFAALRAEARSGFGGVGVLLVERDGRPVVAEVEPDTPADRARLDPGDVLLEVDGWSTAGHPLPRVVERVSGPPGTSVLLRIGRPGWGGTRELRLARAPLTPRSVTVRRHGAFGYLRILRFDPRTARDLHRAMLRLGEAGGLEGLVVDLRGNPGGLLDQAIAVADRWLEAGPIVTTEGRDRARDIAQAHGRGTEPAYPLAVLIDGDTASAAEILAGALQDRGRARLFGVRSFGKGSVQTVIELEDGSALQLTVARYLTPSGRSIQDVGISPDVHIAPGAVRVRLGTPDLDPVLAAALGWLETETGRSAEVAATRGKRSGER